MTWLTWRQHRGQAVFAAAGLAILAVVMVVSGLAMFDSLTELGLDACGSLSNSLDRCDNAAGAFFERFALLQQVGTLLLLLPLLLGLFFGAPLVARELEAGTHRLVWTQGVTRRRWFVVKAGLVLAAATAFMGAYSALVYWWYTPFSRAGSSRFAYLEFDMQGFAPIGYAIFAVALGIAAGTVWRKVLPAMGVTLAGFITARVAVAFLRPSFLPVQERRIPVFADSFPGRLRDDEFLLSTGVYNSDGVFFSDRFEWCGPPGQTDPIGVCAGYDVGTFNLQTFHPASEFWTFQLIETGIFVAAGALLLLLALRQLRRIT